MQIINIHHTVSNADMLWILDRYSSEYYIICIDTCISTPTTSNSVISKYREICSLKQISIATIPYGICIRDKIGGWIGILDREIKAICMDPNITSILKYKLETRDQSLFTDSHPCLVKGEYTIYLCSTQYGYRMVIPRANVLYCDMIGIFTLYYPICILGLTNITSYLVAIFKHMLPPLRFKGYSDVNIVCMN